MRISGVSSYTGRKNILKQSSSIKNSAYTSAPSIKAPINNGAYSINFGNKEFIKPFPHSAYSFHKPEDIPKTFGLYTDSDGNIIGVQNNCGISNSRQADYYNSDSDSEYAKPNYKEMEYKHRQLVDYVSNPENSDTYLPFYEILYPSLSDLNYNYPVKYINSGFMRIMKNGEAEYRKYPDEGFIKGMLSEKNISDTIKRGELSGKFVVPEMKRQGRIGELLKYANSSEHRKFFYLDSVGPIIDAMAQEGRLDEILVHYPDFVGKDVNCSSEVYKNLIQAMLNEGRYDECTEMLGRYSKQIDELRNAGGFTLDVAPAFDNFKKDTQTKLNDFDKKIKNDSETADKELQYAKKSAFRSYLSTDGSRDFLQRIIYDGLTLGLYEVGKIACWVYDRHQNIAEVPKTVEKARKINNEEMKRHAARTQNELKQENIQAAFIRDKQEKIERIKNKIHEELFVPIKKNHAGVRVDVPNCVMLTGANPYTMMEVIDWMGQKSGANYVKIPSSVNINQMQDKILEELEKAEENYQSTGERSIIFVNGMEKLLNPAVNSRGNISCMKDLMSSADEDFHSTIIFYSNHPKNLDPAATASHRVGLKFDLSSN